MLLRRLRRLRGVSQSASGRRTLLQRPLPLVSRVSLVSPMPKGPGCGNRLQRASRLRLAPQHSRRPQAAHGSSWQLSELAYILLAIKRDALGDKESFASMRRSLGLRVHGILRRHSMSPSGSRGSRLSDGSYSSQCLTLCPLGKAPHRPKSCAMGAAQRAQSAEAAQRAGRNSASWNRPKQGQGQPPDMSR